MAALVLHELHSKGLDQLVIGKLFQEWHCLASLTPAVLNVSTYNSVGHYFNLLLVIALLSWYPKFWPTAAPN